MNIEWIDSLRIFPRIVLVLYMVAMGYALDWYLEFEVLYEKRCDAPTLKTLLDEKIPIERAEPIACPIVDTIGRPTGYTALLSVLVGAGAGIFGFYVNSGGRRKENE